MANEVMAGLFGVTPEGLAAQREQALQKQALTFAQLDPAAQAQYQLFLGGNRLGGAIGGMLGAQDPELARVTQRQQLLQDVDRTNPMSIRQAAAKAMQMNDAQAALALEQLAVQTEQQGANLAATRAQELQRLAAASKTATEESRLAAENTREDQLRTELSALPADATDDQVSAVVRKFGKPDQIFNALERKNQAKINAEAKAALEAEKAQRAAEEKERDRQFKLQLAQLSADQRNATSALQRELLQTRIDDLKTKQQEKTDKKEAAKEAAITHAGKVLADVTDASALVGGMTTGLVGKAQSYVPGTSAYNLNQRLLTVKANLGFDRLQQMRDASPTGGALGQVAVQELNALQSTIGSLEIGQSKEELKKNLDKITFHYNNWLKAVQGIPMETPKPATQAPAATGGWSIRPR